MAYATAKNILAITLETSSVYEYARFQIHSQLKEHHVTQWIIRAPCVSKLQKLFKIYKLFKKKIKQRKLIEFLQNKFHQFLNRQLINNYNQAKWLSIDKYFKAKAKNYSIKELNNFEPIVVYDVNKALEKIGQDQYDILLVIGAPYLNKSNILKFKKRLNLHLGYLPYYKGIKTIEWAMIFGEWNKVGFSVHHISEKLDSGEIVYRQTINKPESKSISKIYIECFEEGINSILSAALNPKVRYFKPEQAGKMYSSDKFTAECYLQSMKFLKD